MEIYYHKHTHTRALARVHPHTHCAIWMPLCLLWLLAAQRLGFSGVDVAVPGWGLCVARVMDEYWRALRLSAGLRP